MSATILINEPKDFPLVAIEMLSEIGNVYTSNDDYPKDEVEYVFVRLAQIIGKDFHQDHPNLKCVISPTTGLNHLDLEYFEEHGIEVLSLKGRTGFLDNIRATAEHTICLLLALLRNLRQASNSVFAGEWDRYPYKGAEISGKNILILGYGRLGRQLEALYRAFKADVKAYDIVDGRVPDHIYISLDEGVAWADIISIHVNFTEENRHFFSQELIEKCAGKIIVNTSRGELIDQQALFCSMLRGELKGLATDVLQNEPSPIDDTILKQINSMGNRVIITPHIAGNTHESLERVELYVSELLVKKHSNG